MRRFRLASPVLAVVLAVVTGASLAGASSAVVFGGDVAGYYRQRPTSIHFTSDENVTSIRWSSWGRATAHGTGTLRFSTADRVAPAPVRLTLSKVSRCGTRREYLHLRIVNLGHLAPGEPRSNDVRYTCGSPLGARRAAAFTECQHPVRTGVEVSNVRHVRTSVACRVALDLFAWEAKPYNPARLYGCYSHPGYPYLRKHSFEGWKLHLDSSGFRMTRGLASFNVGGTDFPLNCT